MYPYKSNFRVTSPQLPARTVMGRTAPHNGIDLVGVDKAIYAVSSGTVVKSELSSGVNREFGNRVWIRDPAGKIVCYNHLANRRVSVGQTVYEGDNIGTEGATGRVTGSHLHFEVRDRLGAGYKNYSAAEYIGIANAAGTVVYRRPDYAALVAQKAGLEPRTMEYLRGYRFAGDLLRKLWEAMR